MSSAYQPGSPSGEPLTADAPVNGATQHLTPEERSYQRFQAEDRSLGEIAGDILDNAATLAKQEVALAKAEATQSAKRAGKGAGLLTGAGVAGLLALIALTLMLWWVIAIWIGDHANPALGWSGLIVTLLWGVVAGVLAMLGKSELERIKGLPKTTDTVSKIPNAVTGNEEKNR